VPRRCRACGGFVAAKEAGYFVEGALGGGEADALDRALGDRFEPFEREGEVGAAFGGDESVDLVDDDGRDGAERGCGFGGEEEVEGFGGGDEDVGRMAAEAGALGLGRVAGADGDLGGAEGDAGVAREGGDAKEGGTEIAFDVDGEGLEGADVDDAAAGLICLCSNDWRGAG
jgi:hypothetical protein